jgi:hypothetical protein
MAYLGTKPANQVIDSTLIADGTVTTADIADGAITNAKIASMAASKLTGQLPDANAPSGSVIQVVSTAKTDTFSESISSGAEGGDVTGLTVSITPSSTLNKILVSASLYVHVESNLMGATIYRNGSVVFRGDASGSRTRVTAVADASNAISYMVTLPISFIDSPATTSSVTYTIRLRHTSGITRVCYVNRPTTDDDAYYSFRPASTITVMEIAG